MAMHGEMGDCPYFRGMGRKLLRALALVLMIAAGAGVASADAFLVAGQKVDSPVAFEVAGNEVYAPLLCALAPLKASSAVTPETVAITTAGGREIAISRQRPEATLDGEMRALPSPPRGNGRALLLPTRAVAPLLGFAARWNDADRTLSLTPQVDTFLLETTPDCYRLTLAGVQPLTYKATRVSGPLRLVLDLPGRALAQNFAPYRVENSYLRGVRIAQHAEAPDPKGDIVRVVVDLDSWQPYQVRQSEDRCRLQFEWPLPGRTLPSEAAPVTLSAFNFRRRSAEMAMATLAVSGKPQLTSGASEDRSTVWVDIENAQNQVDPAQLQVGDRLFKQVALAPVADKPGVQRLTLSLAEPTPYAVSCDSSQVRIMLGQCELSDLTIALDAGHGGTDTGAIGRSGLEEKEVTLDIALRLGKLLEQAGARVVYTRCEDANVKPRSTNGNGSRLNQLVARCQIANDTPVDLFVSVHCNANNSRDRRGTETYYRKSDSRPFARVMQQEVVRALDLPSGGARYHPKSIVVLYRTSMPAVLVEVAYLSNAQDEALLADSDFRQRAAQGIANGVTRYVSEGGLLSAVLVREDREAEAAGPEAAPIALPSP